ncbi:aspartyl-phosphate phosphatase Spo0E family protein [Radiobacillus sp. PE A8.2]|uniref:aspartyl-phosphate phosphatase Spo0E family protein n=1 Tax=Radiobacillus sp. PE A8.2 TaxID=3380349 RepID=UPI00388E09BB
MSKEYNTAVMDTDSLHLQIKTKRMQMIQIATKKGLSSSETIRQSQELDALIFQYLCQQQ